MSIIPPNSATSSTSTRFATSTTILSTTSTTNFATSTVATSTTQTTVGAPAATTTVTTTVFAGPNYIATTTATTTTTVTVTTTYATSSAVVQIATSTSTSIDPTIQDIAYTYDANGNITQLTDTGVATKKSTGYTYDALNRLLVAQSSYGDATSTTAYAFTYNRPLSKPLAKA